MLFTVDLVVPADTPADAPAQEELALVAGTVQQIDVVFPPGPALLVHVIVRDSLHQIMPANDGEDINQDWATVTSRMEYPLQKPYILIFEGWSFDDRYPHTITFNIDVSPAGGETFATFIQRLFGSQLAVPGR